MSEPLRSRLSRIYGSAPPRSDLRVRLEKLDGRRPAADSLGRHLGGEWKERPSGRLLSVEREYPLDHDHGGIPLCQLHQVSSQALRLLSGSGFAEFDPYRTLFFDTETTGLAGGAGTCIFLAGVGWFENGHFRIRQLFLPGYDSERAFLEELDEQIHGRSRFRHLVSFNGKSYDLNLLENRFVMQRLRRPFEDFDHLDLLHPSRLLWRGRFEDCALQTLERRLLGLERRGDIPSALIPRIYFNYVQWGRVRGFDRVFRHNRMDLLTLVSLLALASRLLEEPDEKLFVDPLTAARVHWLRGNEPRALEILEGAWRGDPQGSSPELRLQLGLLYKRSGRFGEALDLFLPLTRNGCGQRQAFEEAAKILEHQHGDFAQALELVEKALRGRSDPGLEHRRHRLRCRLEGKRWY